MADKSEFLEFTPKINSRVTLHHGRVFQLVRENVTLPNTVTIDLDIVRHPGATATVPMAENNSVILVKQYRHAVGGFIWEIPAGTLNPRETPLECAKRELIEETGFSADKWQKLGEITPVPGYSDERIHIFLAFQLSSGAQHLDKDEVLNVRERNLKNAIEMIYDGVIQDGKTIAGLLLANHWLKEQRNMLSERR
jgi:ADP-ribose pyrophosphatase